MKVIHYISSIDKTSGGTTAYMQLLGKELTNLVELIVATGLSPKPVQLEGISVQFFDKKLSRWFKLEREFSEFLRSEKPDLVHINGIWNPDNYLFQKVAQKLGIKVILSPHGMLEPYILNRHPLKKKVALALYQHNAIMKAEFLHATAKSEFNNIRKLGYQQKTEIIPNGISIADFPITEPKKADNPKKILFLSRIHSQKGIEFLIEAWYQLDIVLRENWIVEVIGNGEESYIKTLQQKVNNNNLQKQIIIKPPVFGEEKIKVFREASLFVLPTFSENFGIVVAEALASYTPVITTVGAPWEELKTNQCGWWIPLGTEALKSALTHALTIVSEELLVMGENGRKLVEEKYSIVSVASKMKVLYQSIIN